MLVHKQQPFMRSLRRSHTSVAAAAAAASSGSNTPSASSHHSSSSWIHLRSVLFVVASSSSALSSDRKSLKSPWSRSRWKHALLAKQWKSLFDADGRLSDGGVKFLKKVRSGGVEPSIRVDVWPFLLGMYDLKSSKKEREVVRAKKRKEYLHLRRQCRQISKHGGRSFKLRGISENHINEDGSDICHVLDSPGSEEPTSTRPSVSMERVKPSGRFTHGFNLSLCVSGKLVEEEEDDRVIIDEVVSEAETECSSSDSSEDPDSKPLLGSMEIEDHNFNEPSSPCSGTTETKAAFYQYEDFATWQRIIRLDAIRADTEWITCSPAQAEVSEFKARRLAESVGLKDYDNLEPCRIYHAARLVAILEAYSVYDSEIGYCQGMSDLLSPIISVIEEDHVAFWCFVGFMRKARHNFRLDEVGIKRQLNIVAKIIKCKDSHLYRHLEKLHADDCFFVYRMVVVLFRRELTFEQTLCLWEVMWADQAAIRAGISKSGRGRIKSRAPPTDDLLLYTVAACVLQKRKLIMEKYSSVDEIMRECNSMAGHLDIWKLLDDAHDLVVTLHDKI